MLQSEIAPIVCVCVYIYIYAYMGVYAHITCVYKQMYNYIHIMETWPMEGLELISRSDVLVWSFVEPRGLGGTV